MKHFFFAFLLFVPFQLISIDRNPWLGEYLEVQTELSYECQTYRSLAHHDHLIHKPVTSHFYSASAGLSGQCWEIDVEAHLAHTHRQRPALDHVSFIGRYKLFNDIVGDCLTVTPGIILTQAFRHSVHDISSFHHGKAEAELFVAFGREVSCEAFWISRWWGLLGMGIADQGSPWLRGSLYWERRWCDQHQLRVFAHALCGLGGNALSNSFHGYGPIAHRSVDIGARYSYDFEMGLTFNVGYAYRSYARNFPAYANTFFVSIEYPLGIADLCRLVK